MPFIEYVPKKFNKSSLLIIERANEIIDAYAEQGFDLTLRQLYYQFVARDLIPNSMKEYKRLGSIVNDARLAGMIDWNTIVDRTRNLRSNSHWGGPRDIVEACADQFQIDKWSTQPFRPEVWIEKDALVGVIERVCRRNDVPFFSCRGYTSQSEMWSASQRLLGYAENDQQPVIIHLGDHDPSGIDMSRDIQSRLDLFMGNAAADVRRIALNMNQVEQYDPPPNPAKISDSRSDGYIRRFGNESWELDALEPSVMEDLIESTILRLRDDDQWEKSLRKEKRHVNTLKKAAKGMK